MSPFCRHIIISVILTLTITFAGCENNLPVQNRMSSRELYERGRLFLNAPEQPDSALFYFSLLSNRLSPDMDKEETVLCARALNSLGYLYFHYYGNIPYAFEALIMSRQIAHEAGDDALYAQSSLNMAIANQICENLGLAKQGDQTFIDNISDGFDYALRAGDWITILNCFANMSAEVKPGRIPQKIEERIRLFGSLSIPDSLNGKEFFETRYRTSINILDGNYPAAMNLLHAQLGALDEVYDARRVRAQLYSELGTLHEVVGNPDSARFYLTEALAIAQHGNSLYDKAVILKALHDHYRLQGDSANAARNLIDYYQMCDSVMVENNLMTADKMEQVARIKYENRDYSYKVARQQKQLMVALFFAILLVITIPLLILFVKKNRKLIESHRKIYESYKNSLASTSKTDTTADIKPKRKELIDRLSAEELRVKIEDIMANSDEVFSPDFSLDRLAELTGSKSRILSFVINDLMERNFYNMLNERRIQEACLRLEDTENYGNLTIEAISKTLGYKSRTTLITTFKKIVGLTPSEYQRAARLKSLGKNSD